MIEACYSSWEYRILNGNKGKQKAYVKGWEAAENGINPSKCPYNPKIKDYIPTCPYFKSWHLGYENFLETKKHN
jgi:hypothetical protein